MISFKASTSIACCIRTVLRSSHTPSESIVELLDSVSILISSSSRALGFDITKGQSERNQGHMVRMLAANRLLYRHRTPDAEGPSTTLISKTNREFSLITCTADLWGHGSNRAAYLCQIPSLNLMDQGKRSLQKICLADVGPGMVLHSGLLLSPKLRWKIFES